ncbi:MAG: zinc-finger domain-containing protein [Anaplasmataceae bacterium]|nr:zinc-finger domain-containing protein [Anaplasmataceae bacterium]
MSISLKNSKLSNINGFKTLARSPNYTKHEAKKISSIISCNGDDDQGHPVIYLKIDASNKAICTYCGQRFKYIDQSKITIENIDNSKK